MNPHRARRFSPVPVVELLPEGLASFCTIIGAQRVRNSINQTHRSPVKSRVHVCLLCMVELLLSAQGTPYRKDSVHLGGNCCFVRFAPQ